MPFSARRPLIEALETARNSRVLVYFLSDRESHPPGVPGIATTLSGEAQPFFIEQLRQLGHVPRLDLFLYTRGGNTDSVWPLVSLLREFCDHLGVIVPFRAHSGGTMICLGADEIVMTDSAELSPIDPTTGNQFNPADPHNAQNRYGISVEDVASFLQLATERWGIKQEPYVLETLKELTRQVHPLALGNVQRVYMQIRRLAQRLLALHMDQEAEAQRIQAIVKALTEEFFSHVHAVTATEAIPLLGEDWVRKPTEGESGAIWALFDAYSGDLELRHKFSLAEYMVDDQRKDLAFTGAMIETSGLSHVFRSELSILQRPNLPGGVQVQVPPGQPVPLVPWVSRAYDFGVRKIGWKVNDEDL